MDLAGETAKFEADEKSSSRPIDIFVVVSREPSEIMKEYPELTGYPHMPPLWSLGSQQSHHAGKPRRSDG
jgi:alpha-glucosidase/alpha-D-xyloside xylohydrolase